MQLLREVERGLDLVVNDLTDTSSAAPEEVIIAGLTSAREWLEQISAAERQKTC